MSDTSPFAPAPTDIAVVGMAARLPGARNIEEFWRNVRDGVESITRFSDQELLAAGVDAALLADPDYVKMGAVLDDMDMFDAGFFNFSPKDAAIMDPQHRHFLECSYEALENAGHVPERFSGRIGVFAGCGMGAYFMYNILTNKKLLDTVGLFLLRHTGNDKDFLATRLSYNLNLRGPSVNVQTACSTSLVAIHLASQSLLNGECDMSLAGGVTIEIPHRQGYLYQEGEILSHDGHCRAFDAKSTGTVFGSGVGVVVLRRYEDALRDRDTIHAVIRGSAVNNDGSMKVGYLAPSVEGQAEAIAEAIAMAGVSADTITYVATHGTGTNVGDPIEVTALTQAFRKSSERQGYCALGSLKTNIGHLDTAAGVASFIETALALKHKQLPPSLHFESPNPLIDFNGSPFFVNAKLADWNVSGHPRRAGISSLGVGGTNAHIILEEAPEAQPTGASRVWQLLPMSARSEAALDAATGRLAGHFSQHPDANLTDVAYTCQVGRKAFAHRRILVARDVADARTALESRDTKRLVTAVAPQAEPSVVFLFPGGGAQYPNMGLELYQREEVYRTHVDECLRLLKTKIDTDLHRLMFPAEQDFEAAAAELERPLNSILSVFITEYALAKLWMSWGVQPAAMTGHSLGEYTAACLVGVMSLEDTLSMVVLRGKLFERMPAGAMLSVPLPEDEVRRLMGDKLSLAVLNTPSNCVVSGEVHAIEEMERMLRSREIDSGRIKISVAAHSVMLDPFLDEFSRLVMTLKFSAPSVPYVSNLTGTWVRPEDLTDPNYWVMHLRRTVRFSDGIGELLKESNRVLLEVGPGTTLSSLVRQHPGKTPKHVALNSLRHPKEAGSDLQFLLTALGRLWVAGVNVDWETFWGEQKPRRVPLPTYPFEHQRYWIEAGARTYTTEGQAAGEAAPAPAETRATKIPDMQGWFSRPAWKQAPLPVSKRGERLCWLVFADSAGLSVKVLEQLRKMGQDTVSVSVGERFESLAPDVYTLNPGARADYDSLIGELIENGRIPNKILHLWTVAGEGKAAPGTLQTSLELSFHSLVSMMQALAGEDLMHRFDIGIVSNRMQQVDGETVLHPELATLLGPCLVIPQEFPSVTCRSIDIVLDESGVAERIIAELAPQASADRVVAYRGAQRWVQSYEPVRLEASEKRSPRLRKQGVYLITGGLGGAGLSLAEHLARAWQAKLILLSRSGLPARAEWPRWLEAHGEQDPTSRKIRRVEALESLGAEVLVARADVAQLAQVRDVVAQATERFGPINGVIHAAGVIDDGVIQLKTRESSERVLAPKVQGTLALDRALADSKPDFMLLFSSTSSVLGLAGQVDYTAANAFLDAFARSKSTSGGTYTVAVNWGIWQGVGMAVDALAQLESGDSAPRAILHRVAHPLLDACVAENASEVTYSSSWSADRLWVLNEHRLKGDGAFLPGTGYLEIARAAIEKGGKGGTVEIRDLFFMAPLHVRDNERRDVRVTLQKDGEAHVCVVASRSDGQDWREHARGEVCYSNALAPAKLDIAKIAASCGSRSISFEPGQQETRQERHLDFGPRFKNLRRMSFGEGQALALLELGENFAGDLGTYPLHPALMDLATGFGLPLLKDNDTCEDMFVPLSYKRVRVWAPLTRRIYSYLRVRNDDNAGHGVASFDVTILDEHGAVLAEVEEFSVRRITDKTVLAAEASARPQAKPAAAPAKPSAGENLLQLWIKEGILPAEGAQVFERVLANCTLPQVSASSLDLGKLMCQIELSQPKKPDRAPAPSAPAAASNGAGPSGGDIESDLARIWQELLGVDQVGLDDDFFDLGGYSLIAVRLFTKIKKAYKVDLGLAILFEARTVRQLAEVIRKQGGGAAWSALVPLRTGGSKPPFFLVHGVGGNVLGYKDLVRHLPADQALYAIQAQGLNRGQEPLSRMEDLAAYYIKDIRTVQPHGPYYLSGYSFGGIVAFEMAQQLAAQGEKIAFLALFDSDRPNHVLSLAQRVTLHVQHLVRLPLREKQAYVLKKASHLLNRPAPAPPTPQNGNVAESSTNAFKDVRKINFKAYHGYFSKAYPGRITLFRATELGDSGIRVPNLGWNGMALGGLEVHDVPGNHINILYEPNVGTLSKKLIEVLETAQAAEAAAVALTSPAMAGPQSMEGTSRQ